MEEISPIKRNILYFLEKEGISKADFCKKTGISYANIKGKGLKSEIGGSQIGKILSVYAQLSPEWLLTGKGSMLRNTNEETDKEPAHVIKEPVQTYYTREDGRKAPMTATDTSMSIPLIPIEAMAGFGVGEQVAMEYECERYVVPMFRGADFLISVKGSSMIPKYNSGDIVACKRLSMQSIFFQWNKVYVLDTEQGALIKRVKQGSDAEHILIVSENPNYEPFELHLSQVYSVALVMGVIRLE